jgi:hypothetical protein
MVRTTRDNLVMLRTALAKSRRSLTEINEVIGYFATRCTNSIEVRRTGQRYKRRKEFNHRFHRLHRLGNGLAFERVTVWPGKSLLANVIVTRLFKQRILFQEGTCQQMCFTRPNRHPPKP